MQGFVPFIKILFSVTKCLNSNFKKPNEMAQTVNKS